jgi:hypothetical protein
MDYNELLKAELQGVYGDQLQRVSEINRMYAIYSGDQKWSITDGLDYVPTRAYTRMRREQLPIRTRHRRRRTSYTRYLTITNSKLSY